ncbi:MAG TPA: 30S ribosome-binding factor RbfA [Rhodocyclaceae bacterium]|nr:30S ribosome-binding factor RbfA [Rhodocyclaceae bacterium]
MPRDFSRMQRVADQIQRELAELLRTEVKDPRIGLITLTGVEVSPDYAHAKVFYTSLDAEHLKAIETGLKRAAGFLRHELGQRIRLHTIPELHFVYDASVERGVRLSRLIDEALDADQKHHSE